MKAATGELNLTVITIIAIGAVIAFFWFLFPQIKDSITNQWTETSTCVEYNSDGSCKRYRNQENN